jgi:hypothetical protein
MRKPTMDSVAHVSAMSVKTNLSVYEMLQCLI